MVIPEVTDEMITLGLDITEGAEVWPAYSEELKRELKAHMHYFLASIFALIPSVAQKESTK